MTARELGLQTRRFPAGLGWAVWGLLCLLCLAMPTGGLGMATVTALLGLAAWGVFVSAGAGTLVRAWRSKPCPANPVSPALRPASSWPWLTLAWMGFFGWAGLTALWSPYDNHDYVVRFVLSGPVYLAAVMVLRDLSGEALTLARLGVVVGAVGAGAIFMVEIVTGNVLSTVYADGDANAGEIARSLGRGLSAFVAVLPAVIAVLWGYGPHGRLGAVWLVLVAICGGFAFGISSNLFGVAGGLFGVALAVWVRPALAVQICAMAAAASVAFSPAMAVLDALPASLREALPLTWDYRIEIWSYTTGLVLEAPWFGAGFDAARAMNHMAMVRGVELDLMRMHPHNAGLQIYLETGLVGVVMFCLATIGAGRVLARRFSPAVQRACCGVLLSGAAMASVSYGVWQEWWVATAFLGGGLCLLARDDREDDRAAARDRGKAHGA